MIDFCGHYVPKRQKIKRGKKEKGRKRGRTQKKIAKEKGV